jgi:hypothetical protein
VSWDAVHKVFDKYGLWHGVPSEPWHTQAVVSWGWIPGPVPQDDVKDVTVVSGNAMGDLWLDTTDEAWWIVAPWGTATRLRNPDPEWGEQFGGLENVRAHKNATELIRKHALRIVE